MPPERFLAVSHVSGLRHGSQLVAGGRKRGAAAVELAGGGRRAARLPGLAHPMRHAPPCSAPPDPTGRIALRTMHPKSARPARPYSSGSARATRS